MRLLYQGCLRQCTFITKRGSQSTAPSAFWKFSHFLQIVSSCRLQRTSTTFYEDRGPKTLHIHRKMVPWYIDFCVYLSKKLWLVSYWAGGRCYKRFVVSTLKPILLFLLHVSDFPENINLFLLKNSNFANADAKSGIPLSRIRDSAWK